MKVETFRGKTMAEALARVKKRFGAQAVILSTRANVDRGLLGMVAKPYVEITAARQMADVPGPLRSGGAAGKPVPVRPASARRTAPAARTEVVGGVERSTNDEAVAAATTNALLSEVGSLKTLVTDLVRETKRSRAPQLPGELFETYQQLIANDVAEKIAYGLVERVRGELSSEHLADRDAVRAKLAGLLQSMLPTAGPIRVPAKRGAVVIALIGPTGVGKTTTIAKLAANFRLREARKVGLITVDTYRIAAVEQLKTYAQIIEVPLRVANSPRQLREAVTSMADCDVVLIDTAGRSQRDKSKLAELQQYFDAVRPDELHLVLSGAASESVLQDTIQRFAVFAIDSMIFTKLDEAIGFGVILNCLHQAKSRLSYVTMGQDVPDDIRVGESKALAGLILRGGDPRRKDAVIAV